MTVIRDEVSVHDDAPIDPTGKPCACYGSPILLVFMLTNRDRQTGFECGKCQRRWPMAKGSFL